MGGAFVSVADDAIGVYWNPAGIARIQKNVISINHTRLAGRHQLHPGDLSLPHGFLPGTIAINARSLYMDAQPVRTVFRPDGEGKTFDAGDVAVGVTYGRSLTDKFSAGISANYVQSTLATYSASATTFDFGTLYDTGYRSLKIGMSIQNIGSDMKFIDDTVKMPTVFRVGMSMNLYEDREQPVPVRPRSSAIRRTTTSGRTSGMEYGFKEFFFVRGGYQFNYDLERFSRRSRVQDPLEPELRGDGRLLVHRHERHGRGASRLRRLPLLVHHSGPPPSGGPRGFHVLLLAGRWLIAGILPFGGGPDAGSFPASARGDIRFELDAARFCVSFRFPTGNLPLHPAGRSDPESRFPLHRAYPQSRCGSRMDTGTRSGAPETRCGSR